MSIDIITHSTNLINVGDKLRYDYFPAPGAARGRGFPAAPGPGEFGAVACHTAHNGSVKAYLSGSGTVVELKAEGFQSRPNKGGGKRGEIKLWSKASRRRLLYRLSEVEWEKIPVTELFHVDLTYPGEFWPDGRKIKRDLKALRCRLDRLFGKGNYGLWWKLEFQRRGWPEFNCVLRVLRVPISWVKRFPGLEVSQEAFIILFRKWLAKAWNEIAAPGNEKHLKAGTEVSRPRNKRKMALYMVKYLAKTGGRKEYQHTVPEGFTGLGRWWGIINSELFPVNREIVEVPIYAFHTIRRIIRRYCRSNSTRKWMPKIYSPYSKVKVLAGIHDKSLFNELKKLIA